jgi:predicted O-linked N-acetylglucosamine transferase (SPINDLY family)
VPPSDPASGHLLRAALAARRSGDRDAAVTHCRDAIAADPTLAAAWTLLGTLLRSDDAREAERALQRAVGLDPRDADAHFQLGNLLRDAARYDEAVAAYTRAVELAPRHPALLNNLGLAWQGAGDMQRAHDAYRAALALDPGHPQSMRNLAHLLCLLRRYNEALPLLSRHLDGPGMRDTDLWIDRGIALHHLREHARAEHAFRRALELAPGDVLILTNLASLLVDAGDPERALPLLEGVCVRDPSASYAASLLAYCRQHACQWDGLDALHARIRQHIASDPDAPLNAFAALSVPMSAREQLCVAQRWARDLAPAMAVPAVTPGLRRSRPRLGYLSSDLRTHAIAFLLCEVWERQRGGPFETIAYSIGPVEASPTRERIERAFDRFVDCSAVEMQDAARRIRNDGIDLLIDLNGYTTHARSEILALQPAPVQASWLGYLGTLGAPWCQYVITDRVVTPDDQQPNFSERFLYLPDCYCPSDTRRAIATAPPTREQCGLPASGFVFCCFNQAYKILPPVYDAWMRILQAIQGSILWLAPANATATANLRREAAQRGVDPARIAFAPRAPLSVHLARHVHADLVLDTLPYNAGTTANDALLMGVPVLTVAGTTMAGRVAASQLHAIGAAALVARDLGEYERRACELARNADAVTELRARLVANRATHPLFDMARFVAGLHEMLERAVSQL